ncbi:hypothetical protein Ancab_022138 [Ancistrocladus abbreviatus]
MADLIQDPIVGFTNFFRTSNPGLTSPSNPRLSDEFDNHPTGNIGQPDNSLSICNKTTSSDDLVEVDKGAVTFITPHDEPICPETNLFEDYHCRGFMASLGQPCLRRAPLANSAALAN